ncbi:MAG: hypothetical protein JO343_10415 [Candidatus Eremiobacteraeota bacterium]|nr:hypothetical protein [Candidatus Eremiobacteraeota bacterium]MBV8460145.1 hypothetical protein [Candidatus Eremiobacteraeota bacterium]
MHADTTGIEATQLRDVCGQFEHVLLASLLPASLFTCATAPGQQGETEDVPPSGAGPEIFREALATAIERSGGVGLGAELAQLLSGHAP